MQLKGIEWKLLLSAMVTGLVWYACAILSIGYEAGTDDSNFSRLCYQTCDLLTFSRVLFDGWEIGAFNILVPLLITSMIIAITIQIAVGIWRRIAENQRNR